ncbi:MAG: hypothetical protein V7K89_01680 [Nostoc sp.]|uniref:hypothetical protein n=1 Tax=Nostoc sp. TaxID=1180 RepID=UPI002FFB7B15
MTTKADQSNSSYSPVTIPPLFPMPDQSLSNLEMQKEADRLVLNQYAPAGLVVDTNLEILQFRGHISPYLEPIPGQASLNLLKMVKQELRRELQTTISQAKLQKLPLKRQGLQIRNSERIQQININVIPFQAAAQECFLILFEEALPMPLPAAAATNEKTPSRRKTKEAVDNARLK